MKNSCQRIAEALRATAAMIATVDDRPSGGWGSRTITLADVAGIFHAFADQIDAVERPDLRDRSTTGSSASAKEAAEARQRVAFGTSPHGSADDVPDPLRRGAFIVYGRRFEYERTPRGYFGWFVDAPSRSFIAKTFSDLQDAAKADKSPPASAAQQAAEVDNVRPVAYVAAEVADLIAGPFYASAAPPTGAGSHFLSDYRFLDDGRLYSFHWQDTSVTPPRSQLRRVNDPGSLAAVPVAAWRHATPLRSHLCFSFDVLSNADTPDRPPFVIGRDRFAAMMATLERFAAHITKGPR